MLVLSAESRNRKMSNTSSQGALRSFTAHLQHLNLQEMEQLLQAQSQQSSQSSSVLDAFLDDFVGADEQLASARAVLRELEESNRRLAEQLLQEKQPLIANLHAELNQQQIPAYENEYRQMQQLQQEYQRVMASQSTDRLLAQYRQLVDQLDQQSESQPLDEQLNAVGGAGADGQSVDAKCDRVLKQYREQRAKYHYLQMLLDNYLSVSANGGGGNR